MEWIKTSERLPQPLTLVHALVNPLGYTTPLQVKAEYLPVIRVWSCIEDDGRRWISPIDNTSWAIITPPTEGE